MSWQIVKQSDGRYAIWSTVVDGFIVEDAGKEEIIECYKERFEEKWKRKKKELNKTIEQLDEGKNPYFQFAKDDENNILEENGE